MQATVAIVGRPNVGKSALFNKLTGTRTAIVEDTPGVTRDRLFGPCEWLGHEFLLIDTGGLEPKTDEPMLQKMRMQTQIAIESADVIVFVADIRAGVTANDSEVALILQKSGKPVVLCVNKCDTVGEVSPDFYEFYALGLGDPVAVSSVHGHGTGDLLDRVIAHFPPIAKTLPADDAHLKEEEAFADATIRVALIGKPNSGKSSLLNKLCGEERALVSAEAGTTRDTVDAVIIRENHTYQFIDTAGLRRHSRVNEAIERYAVLRAKLAIDRADVCVILIDATEGFTEQDSKVAGLAHEAGKGCIVTVNKWDLVEKDGKTMDEQRKSLMNDFSFMSYAPIIFISAKTGQRLDRLLELVNYVDEQNAMRIPTGRLNELLADAQARVQPPTDKGRRLKIYYMTQASTRPPTFVCFVNRADLFHYSYQRYIENQIRSVFGLEGTPVRMVVRERDRADVK